MSTCSRCGKNVNVPQWGNIVCSDCVNQVAQKVEEKMPEKKVSTNFRQGEIKILSGAVFSTLFYQMHDESVWGVRLTHVRTHHEATYPTQIDWKPYWPKFETLTAHQIQILMNNPSREWFDSTWKRIGK